MGVITGPAIQHAEICRITSCLSIEVNPATSHLRHSRGSMMNWAKHWCGSPKRTKKGVLLDLAVWFYANGGTYENIWDTIERAIGAYECAKLRKKCLKAREEWIKAQQK